jgi:ribosome maturation factor RimP
VISAQLTQLLETKFQEEEFADCFIIEIKSLQNKRVEIYVDSDSGITFKKCQLLSRYLEAEIDEKGWLGEKYTLEVSSPGITRPLKFARQYPRNIGRKLEVKQLEGETKIGTLIEVDEKQITLESKQRIKEGKKKKTIVVQDIIPFDNIKETKVKITF